MLRCRLWRGGSTTVGIGLVTISIFVSDCRSLTNGSTLPVGVTPVISSIGPADDRWDAVERVSCSAVISIGEDSEFRGNFLV
jgi:hypothetical protein